MTRRDFILMAGALKQARPEMIAKTKSEYATEKQIWDRAVLSVANALAGTNPGFDRARFLAACGME